MVSASSWLFVLFGSGFLACVGIVGAVVAVMECKRKDRLIISDAVLMKQIRKFINLTEKQRSIAVGDVPNDRLSNK